MLLGTFITGLYNFHCRVELLKNSVTLNVSVSPVSIYLCFCSQLIFLPSIISFFFMASARSGSMVF